MMIIQIVSFLVAGFISYQFVNLSKKMFAKPAFHIYLPMFGLCVSSVFGILAATLLIELTGVHSTSILISVTIKEPVGALHTFASETPSSILILISTSVVVALVYLISWILCIIKIIKININRGIPRKVIVSIGMVIGLLLGNYIIETGDLLANVALDGSITEAEKKQVFTLGFFNTIIPNAQATEEFMRQVAYGIWLSIFGSIGGVVYGHRKLKRDA